MKKNLYKSLTMLLAPALVFVLAIAPITVEAQWSIYDGGLSPEVLTPRPFLRASNVFTSPDTFNDHNLNVVEPGVPSNNLLRMSNTMNGTQFLWRMNFASIAGTPAFPAIDVTNLTVVMRVRGHAGRTHALDLDLDYNGQRTRVSVNTADRLGRIRNGTGTNRPMPVPTTEWVIYRFAMTSTQTRVFVNENPVPVMTITPVSGSQRHFRFGDGDTGATLGADIDWVIWDVSGAFAPGEGTPVPFSDLTPTWDVRLSDLKVGPTTISGFNPAVTNYEVVLPAGTTEIPVITATANLPATPVTITQATTLPGVATIAVASADGLTTRTYLVHLRVGSNNADLSAITVGGTALTGFDPAITTYEMILPAATTTPPTVAATLADIRSTMVLTQATQIPGTATIVVTSDDRTTTKTYTIKFRHLSTNANLSTITVGGTALAGFSPTVLTYEVALPTATTTPPTVAATTADALATVVVTQATAIPGSAAIVVTAEDGTTKNTYTVNFRLQSTNANLSAITVAGVSIPGFSAGTLAYSITLPFGTTIPPTVGATIADPLANMVITQATAIPGAATILVTAENGTTTLTYTVNFAVEQLNWSLFQGEVSPEVLTPRPFVRATNAFTAPDTFDDHNLNVPEPGIPSNNLLRMSNNMPGTQFLWRMNFAAITGPPAFPAIDVTNLTVVMRVKGHTGKTHALDFDMDYNGERTRVSINNTDRLGRVRNGTGTNRQLPVPVTEWVIYRFVMTETQTRVFVNENPVPVMTITPATVAGTNRHFRFGDGDSGQTFGSDIDWVIWDVTGAFAPGEGSRVPYEFITPQWDVRLSDLSIGGNAIAGFHPAVTNYEVVLPAGTTAIPAVTATANLPATPVTITQATTLPGVATIAVTSADGLTTRTYLVHIRTVSSNANLSAITVGGTALAGFNPAITTYTMALPVATTTPPTVAATPTDIWSTMVITQATAIPGAATIAVTAEDGTTVRTYTVNFRHAATNANLSAITVGGTAIAGFSPTVLTYEVALPPATTTPPTVAASTADAQATVVVTQATAIPGSATIVVTAEDGTTKITYTVNFRLQSANANLSGISVGGTAITGFGPDVLIYNVILAAGTTIAPTVTAVLADTKATLVITQATAVPGKAIIVVTAEAGNQKTYEVNFTRDVTSIQSPAEKLFKIYPNPATNTLNLNWGGNARAEVEIFNLVGRKVLSKTVESNSTRLDIGHLPAGVYIIRLKSGYYEVRQTFIKQQQ